jgi:transcriptional regulator with XRE-family HTH domain
VGADDSPAYQRRSLGRRLRALRTAARLTFEEAHDRLEMSDTTLNRIERGTTGVGVHVVKSMLDLYGVGAQEWEPILALVREANRKGWWTSFGLTNKSYPAMETAASVVWDFALAYLPGLLQTEDYMTAVFRSWIAPRTDRQLRNQVSIRQIRQQRLSSAADTLELVAIIDEGALRRLVGGRGVMRAQLRHLLYMAELESVTIHILPAEMGAHVGLLGPFSVLQFADPGEPDVAFFENIFSATFVKRDADVDRCRLTVESLRSSALDPERSMALIRRVLHEL